MSGSTRRISGCTLASANVISPATNMKLPPAVISIVVKTIPLAKTIDVSRPGPPSASSSRGAQAAQEPQEEDTPASASRYPEMISSVRLPSSS